MKENKLPVEIGGVLYDVPVRVSLHITALEMDLARANAQRNASNRKIEELTDRLAEIEAQCRENLILLKAMQNYEKSPRNEEAR